MDPTSFSTMLISLLKKTILEKYFKITYSTLKLC